MVEFSRLDIGLNKKNVPILYIDGNVKTDSYYDGVYLDRIDIDTEKTYVENGPSTTPIWSRKYPDEEKDFALEASNERFHIKMGGTLHGKSGPVCIDITFDEDENADSYYKINKSGDTIFITIFTYYYRTHATGEDPSEDFIATQLNYSPVYEGLRQTLYNLGYSLDINSFKYEGDSGAYLDIPYYLVQEGFIYEWEIEETLPEGDKKFSLELNKNELLTDPRKHLFFIYITVKGLPSEDVPCGKDNTVTLGTVYYGESIYNDIMNSLYDLSRTCQIPRDFINQILQYKAFDLALNTGHYQVAVDYFNNWFLKRNIYTSTSNCGCHG